jgi:hypothetical protein
LGIHNAEELLFDEWEMHRNGFVRDGVVCESSYNQSSLKIAIILKEVNDLGGGGWDLRTFIASTSRRQTWDNVARWVHGIRNLTSVPNWDFYSTIPKDLRLEALKSICVMNLKKSPGTHTTDTSSLKEVASADREYIKKQYALYNPDLTICGGTGDLFKEVLAHKEKWLRTSRGIWWYEREPQKNVVAFAHPEARVQNSLLVYGLLDALSEIYRVKRM